MALGRIIAGKSLSALVLLAVVVVGIVLLKGRADAQKKDGFANNSAGGYVLLVFVMIIMLMGALALPLFIQSLDQH